MRLKLIGVIGSSFVSSDAISIQSSKSIMIGEAEVTEKYLHDLHSLDGFFHIILLYLFSLFHNLKL